ncbi:MAG: hypothetical protein AAFY71_26785 [Bacteroidota bacterium]
MEKDILVISFFMLGAFLIGIITAWLYWRRKNQQQIDSALFDKNREIERLNADLDLLEVEGERVDPAEFIRSKKSMLFRKDEKIAQLQRELDNLQVDGKKVSASYFIIKTQKDLEEKENEISRLKESLEKYEGIVLDREEGEIPANLLTEKDNEILQLKGLLGSFKIEDEEVSPVTFISKKREEIDGLKLEIQQYKSQLEAKQEEIVKLSETLENTSVLTPVDTPTDISSDQLSYASGSPVENPLDNQEEIIELKSRLAEKEAELLQFSQQNILIDYNGESLSKEEFINRVSQKLEAKEVEFQGLKAEFDNLSMNNQEGNFLSPGEAFAHLKKQLDEKNAEIARLTTQLEFDPSQDEHAEPAGEAVSQLKNEVEEKNSLIEKLQNQLSEMTSKLESTIEKTVSTAFPSISLPGSESGESSFAAGITNNEATGLPELDAVKQELDDIKQTLLAKDSVIEALKSQLAGVDAEKELAREEASRAIENQLAEKDNVIAELKAKLGMGTEEEAVPANPSEESSLLEEAGIATAAAGLAATITSGFGEITSVTNEEETTEEAAPAMSASLETETVEAAANEVGEEITDLAEGLESTAEEAVEEASEMVDAVVAEAESIIEAAEDMEEENTSDNGLPSFFTVINAPEEDKKEETEEAPEASTEEAASEPTEDAPSFFTVITNEVESNPVAEPSIEETPAEESVVAETTVEVEAPILEDNIEMEAPASVTNIAIETPEAELESNIEVEAPTDVTEIEIETPEAETPLAAAQEVVSEAAESVEETLKNVAEAVDNKLEEGLSFFNRIISGEEAKVEETPAEEESVAVEESPTAETTIEIESPETEVSIEAQTPEVVETTEVEAPAEESNVTPTSSFFSFISGATESPNPAAESAAEPVETPTEEVIETPVAQETSTTEEAPAVEEEQTNVWRFQSPTVEETPAVAEEAPVVEETTIEIEVPAAEEAPVVEEAVEVEASVEEVVAEEQTEAPAVEVTAEPEVAAEEPAQNDLATASPFFSFIQNNNEETKEEVVSPVAEAAEETVAEVTETIEAAVEPMVEATPEAEEPNAGDEIGLDTNQLKQGFAEVGMVFDTPLEDFLPASIYDRLKTLENEGISVSDHNGHFLVFNDRLQEFTGYTRHEANDQSGKSFLERLYPDPYYRGMVAQNISKIPDNGTFDNNRAVITSKSGLQKVLDVSSTLFYHNGMKYYLSYYVESRF